ncbi:MAG: hypothetical protein HZY75_13195 [Nocardioidaceae bacterium]|nr:MAG: hypothetical protein HZY75_13195 [Nocardioidaceae bacterium]
MSDRRTIRRYAHELYPHPDEWEVRPLEVEVPYLYARMVGLDMWNTDWFDLGNDPDKNTRRLAHDRTMLFIAAKEKALLADAIFQGITSGQAWEWAMSRAADEASEIAYERAAYYDVPIRQIKPYPILGERDHHYHDGERVGSGVVQVLIKSKESECPVCTEPIEAES